MATARDTGEAVDWAGGVALGLLLGLLIGLSVTPVVSIVVTALVGLLAGLFGLGEKSALGISAAGARRLAAFGFAAVIATPIAIWLRTHDVLAPSLADQRATLREIGYADGSPEQKEMLRFLRYGIAPAGSTVTAEASRGATARGGVLYAGNPAALCGRLMQAGATPDLLLQLDNAGDAKLRDMATRIRALPPEKQTPALDFARIFLCEGG
ncbi:hypothetical protein [Desertibaculum subflavum]|uniref:hypothetical protein n=1 Tax=Desertibaculum subflavum TaxID=2268458 RepID=UPI000E675A55